MDLVTGGAGFIGSHLVDRLLAEGRAVRILDRVDRRLSHWAGRVDQRVADLQDASAVRDALEGVTRVFHCAALGGVRQSQAEPDRYHHDNVTCTQILLDHLTDQKLVFLSSSSVYGETKRPSREMDPVDPRSVYAETKVLGEALVRDVPGAVILRPFTVYGPRQRPTMAVSRFVKAARDGTPITVFGDGSSRRDHTFVGDVVALIMAAAEHPDAGIFNAGCGTPISLAALICMIEEMTGETLQRTHAPVHPSDVQCTWADRTRVEAVFALPSPIPLKNGIRIRGLSA